jgi:hypothetical protein
MITPLRYINIRLPPRNLTLQLDLRFYRDNYNEGVVERELHSDCSIHQKVLYAGHCSSIYREPYSFVQNYIYTLRDYIQNYIYHRDDYVFFPQRLG